MSKRVLLGIDIGTSGCKMTAFDPDGTVICSRTETYETYYPFDGGAEQEALDWWSAVCRGVQALIHQSELDPSEVAGIGVDGHSWACLPVDRNGSPLRRAMIWLDRRAENEAHWLRQKVGEDRLVALDGNPVDPAYIVPKMLWMRSHEPDLYAQSALFLQSNAFIVYKLTGVYSQDYSQAYGFHFFDMSKGRFDDSVADEIGIPFERLAPLRHCHEVVGTVTSTASLETGLAEGTPVVAGGLDAACCSLGAGVVEPSQTQEQGGQSGGMSIQVDRPVIHPRLILGYHVIPDTWLLQGGTVGGGGALRWFDRELGAWEHRMARERGVSSYEIMSEEAARVRPGCNGLVFLPYMAGERSPIWDSNARGVFFGLSYTKSRAHMIRSVMEGVAFSLRHNLETAKEVGADVTELISVGGSANSKIWTQIKSDVCGKPIHVPFSDHATTLGAAILAGVGVGVYKSFSDGVRMTVRIQRTHLPDPERHRIYNDYYQLYLDLYDRLKETFVEMAGLERA